jgi:ABC-type amino acid transport system permease subunit
MFLYETTFPSLSLLLSSTSVHLPLHSVLALCYTVVIVPHNYCSNTASVKCNILKLDTSGLQSIRAKNSYSIEHRLIDYVPTAFYGAVVVVSPDARAASSSYLS